jgi:hypothetical protein
MNEQRVIAGLLALIAAGVWWPAPGPTRWEYRVESIDDRNWSAEASVLGRDAWELVTARRATTEAGPVVYECIFKRPAK